MARSRQSLDTTRKEKNIVYMATVIDKFIQQIVNKNIIQVCIDNALVMLNAGKLICSLYPHIFFQGCVAHAMDLLVKVLAKMKWVKDLLDQARALVKFIKIRQMPLALF